MASAYMDIPDAPWIRDAELNGAPGYREDIKYFCPVCGADEPEDFVFDQGGDIIGCSCCTFHKDAYEYMAQKKGNERLIVW